MRDLLRLFGLAVFCVAASGCGGSDLDRGPFGAPERSPLLAPFAGDWAFEFEKTLAAMQAAGATADELTKLRKLYADHPEFGGMHPDLTITGNLAVGAGFPSSEYRFFEMHSHGQWICGKAWHHEDRFDPGDMSKCYTRLKLEGTDLHLQVKMQDGLPSLTDPEFRVKSPAEGGSAEACTADKPAGSGWSEWNTFVFSRKKS